MLHIAQRRAGQRKIHTNTSSARNVQMDGLWLLPGRRALGFFRKEIWLEKFAEGSKKQAAQKVGGSLAVSEAMKGQT